MLGGQGFDKYRSEGVTGGDIKTHCYTAIQNTRIVQYLERTGAEAMGGSVSE